MQERGELANTQGYARTGRAKPERDRIIPEQERAPISPRRILLIKVSGSIENETIRGFLRT